MCLYKLLIKKETYFQIGFDLFTLKIPVNILESRSSLIKPQRGSPGERFKPLDKEGYYGMQNKKFANVATSVKNCDVVTRGDVNTLKNEPEDKHEGLFQNLIVISSTSDEQL